MVPGGCFEIRHFLIGQTRWHASWMIGQQIAQQKNTLLAQQESKLPITASFAMTGPKERLLKNFKLEPPRRLFFFRPSPQRRVGNATSHDALHLERMMPVLALIVGVGRRRQFLHFITEGPEEISASSIKALPDSCKSNYVSASGESYGLE